MSTRWRTFSHDDMRNQEKSPKAHSVKLSSEYVDLSAGTGLVHCALAAVLEDYEVGTQGRDSSLQFPR
jgi:isoleucyl-tRNA synthetase